VSERWFGERSFISDAHAHAGIWGSTAARHLEVQPSLKVNVILTVRATVALISSTDLGYGWGLGCLAQARRLNSRVGAYSFSNNISIFGHLACALVSWQSGIGNSVHTGD